MEKAKLIKQGKGWKILKLSNNRGPVCNWKNIPEEWDGKEVEVLFNKSGQVQKIQFEDKTIESPTYKMKKNNKRHSSRQDHSYQSRNRRKRVAKAPYNFVPLNDELIKGQSLPKNGHSTFDLNRLSGHIDLDIEAVTPLFIRGNGNRFLTLNGKPIIPGSSLRGLIKNFVKIVSYGKMSAGEDFEDKTLFKRGTLPEMKEGQAPKAGFLYKNKDFYIKPAKVIDSFNYGREFFYTFWESGCQFSTGKFGNKKPRNFKFQIDTKTSDKLLVPLYVKRSYENDKQRASQVPHIFNCARKMKVNDVQIPNQLGMPVFYTLDENGKVFSISHAKYGRIPYRFKVSAHIPNNIKEDNVMDFAETIFGTTERATRVYFEDALTSMKDTEMKEKQPKILSFPKPTSYQLYLEQGKNEGNGDKDWNDTSAKIRGYKMYWHRKTSNNKNDNHSWIEESQTKSDSHPDPIKAAKPGTKFSGRIRFDNLTEEELGCLLFTLQLPESCYHKLGMAKPLGLGTVKINPTLKLINRQERYSQIFNEKGNWNTGLSSSIEVEKYKDAFASYILKALGMAGGDSLKLWQENRLQEMKKMLFWEDKKMGSNEWLKDTEYMKVGSDEYRYKNVLPSPRNV